MKERRRKETKKRKNFVITFLIIITLWSGLVSIIYFIDPQRMGAVPLFFFVLFLSLFLTLATIFANSRRGAVAALAITFFAILRYLEVGNFLNLLLIAGAAIALEFHFSRK